MKKEVEINAFAFTNKREFTSIPRTITVDDRRYCFVDLGLRYLIQKRGHLIRLFDMTDGQQVYRLKNEDNHWTLESIKALV
jgi:hypothetical protein